MELPPEFNLKALRIFSMVAESRNMTKTARLLNTTQSSVSEAIAQLEGALEADLFDRNTRPIKLTHAGVRLYRVSGEVLRATAEAYNAVREVREVGLSSLTVAMVESMANILGPVLVDEMSDISNRWRIWVGSSLNNHAELLNHAADIIITASDELDDMDSLERHALVRENFIVIVPKSWRLKRIDLEDLSRRPFIRYSQRSAIGLKVERQINRMKLDLPFRMEFDSIAGLHSSVAKGLGWSLSTPLCLMNDVGVLDRVEAVPLRRHVFSRILTMIGRSGYLGAAPERLAGSARETLQEMLVGTLFGRWPWLSGEIDILD
ncbi:LysR family transcriptional regulator [Pelagibius sp. CAU 1746]|uniref:LysR family transcriptional regulator n=1 Tax=Pelagibius sp. CAU 1746 TaxID=3140370 RepID=UPI00325A797F